MPESPYTSPNFDPVQETIRNSARLVVPIVVELLEPRSVCDVGCGRGTWLSVFQEHGVDDFVGIDGEHVNVGDLEVPRERFIAADLAGGLDLDRKFDLSVCLEVAEQLPKESAAPLVGGLVGLAPAVLFSAAIPHEGGPGHVNEQWPDYWEARFSQHGYIAVDCIRPRIWHEPHVRFLYAQNTLLFVDHALLHARPKLKQEYECSRTRPLSVVHPGMLQRVVRRSWMDFSKLAEARDSGQLSDEQFQARIGERISPHRSPVQATGAGTARSFEDRLQSLDVRLFDHVPSETSHHDRTSLLALHNACREAYGTFAYLEIGSHLGGSLQVLLVDDRCSAITSIDARPPSQPDSRGRDFAYPGNYTERMLAYLRRVPGADLTKLRTVDASTQDLSAASFEGAVQLCLIDAEHTHDAALQDARFCRRVLGEQGAMAFHDRHLVRAGIEEFVAELDPGSFTAYPMQGSVFVVELGSPRLVGSEWVAGLVPEPGEELVPPPSAD